MPNVEKDPLIGKRFGKWTVLYRDLTKYKTRDIRYICKCDCGTIKSVLKKYLLNGKSLSCGCLNKKYLTGMRFGRLVVLETLYNYNGYNRATYKCRCDCGKIVYIKSASIYNTFSCGCSRRADDETGKKYGKLTIVRMLYNFSNGETYCECLCDCGNYIVVRLSSLHTGNTTSCGCNHSPDLIGMKFGKLTVIREVPSNTKQRMWLCECECGNQICLSSYVLTSGHTQSCGCLIKSHGELLIENILNDLKIKYINQYKFKDCRNKKPLPFDFYIPELNICIEFDGIQHFEPIDFFGGTESFIITKNNDKIKEEYCLKNDVKLLRIPYYLKNEEIKTNIINFIQNPVTTTII